MPLPVKDLLDPTSLRPEHLLYHQRKPFQYNDILIDVSDLQKKRARGSAKLSQRLDESGLDMGDLSSLPNEVIYNLLTLSPITSVLKLRQTNHSAKQLIERWQPYQVVMENQAGLIAVGAMVATDAGAMWTFPQLADVLFTTRCDICGNHGEILHLLKLKRCCMKCLAEERELLAIHEGYARHVMGLSEAEIASVPHLSTIPRKTFWAYPMHISFFGRALDYTAAMEIASKKGWTAPAHPSPEHKDATYLQLKPTNKRLKEDERSIQPRQQTPIHERRIINSKMTLPPSIVHPPETDYVQYMCSVKVSAMTRTLKRDQKGVTSTSVDIVPGYHCEGCAFYWNYHSPLPYQFHQLYAHDKRKGPTEFTEHVRHCFYAHCHWTRINNQLNPVPLDRQITSLNARKQTCYTPRNPRTKLRDGFRDFEMIPNRAAQLITLYEDECEAFQQPCEWPVLETPAIWSSPTLGDEKGRNKKRKRSHDDPEPSPLDRRDQYWDVLVSQDAISQANWACADSRNGHSSLFKGPYRMLVARMDRFRARGVVCAENALSFDRF
ncbi:hypothetical protein PV10_08496 [Exophiala mesophila]|uniref:F-box domain-containing protein n=1 Tax=Exophiala mesophila TaxID=212818 RepID=A0A0D1WJ00_EXOME|nr:uncharacterized protein PV10_08496 [Exophiala mesophila]KIV88860.1 hypothetical protein PV10_08496 [Exophiala mesophila]